MVKTGLSYLCSEPAIKNWGMFMSAQIAGRCSTIKTSSLQALDPAVVLVQPVDSVLAYLLLMPELARVM